MSKYLSAATTAAVGALLLALSSAPASAARPAPATQTTAGERAATAASCSVYHRRTANYQGYTAGYSWAWNVEVGPGATGDRVREIQCLLNWDPQYTGTPLTVDGVYGSTTTWAVERYQWATGLSEDGIVGPATWRTLRHGGEV